MGKAIDYPVRSTAAVIVSLVLFAALLVSMTFAADFIGFNNFFINILAPFVSAGISPDTCDGNDGG